MVYLVGLLAPSPNRMRHWSAAAALADDWSLRGAKVSLLIDSVRADPRFHEVLKCVHLE